MSPPHSLSPQPRPTQHWQPQSQLPDLSVLSTPSFDASLPLPRPIPSSGKFRRSGLAKNSRLASSQRQRRTRSVTSTGSHSSDGSLGDFSMENYTIDIAKLGKNEGVARPVGYEQAFQTKQEAEETPQKQQEDVDEDYERTEGDAEDLMRGYEVNLGGFGDKPSSVVVEDIVQPRDEVSSEDEGPEDFTQNMEMWMRGNRKWKKEQDKEIAEGHEPDPDPELDLRQAMADGGGAEESVFEPLGTSTPAPPRNHAIIEKDVEEEAKLQAPPLTRLNTEMAQNQAAEEVFDRISALQAEVESMRLEGEARRASHEALEEEHRDLMTKYESAEKDHRSERDVLRNQCAELKLAHAHVKDSLMRENKDLTEEYNAAMEQIRLLEKQVSPPQDSMDVSLRAKYENSTRELETLRVTAETERNEAQSEINALRQELEKSRDEVNACKRDIVSIQETHRSEINQLKAELEARQKEVALERKESIDRANEDTSLADSISEKDRKMREQCDEAKALKNELNHALEQLTETRRIVETVEDENDRLEQRNERQAADIADLKAGIKSRELQEPKVAAVKDAPTSTVDEAAHKAALEALDQQHQTALSSLRAALDKKLQTLRSALHEAKSASQEREKNLAKAHSDQITSLTHQLTTLKSHPPQHPPPATTTDPTEPSLRTAILAINKKLSKATASLASARGEAEAARQETEDALQTNAMVNAELEARFQEAVESREREWRGRVELLFRERERMGRALLWGWGREEVGVMDGGKQAYRYRFVERGS